MGLVMVLSLPILLVVTVFFAGMGICAPRSLLAISLKRFDMVEGKGDCEGFCESCGLFIGNLKGLILCSAASLTTPGGLP